jgi:hypothetical protein
MSVDALIATTVKDMLDPPPGERPDWQRVLDAAGRRRGVRRGVVVAALVTAVAACAGTAVAVRITVFGSSAAMGTEVARSGALVLRADIGKCGGALYVYDAGGFLGSESGMAVRGLPDCEHPPARKHSVGWMYGAARRTGYLAGVTSADVARLSAVLDDGTRLAPALHRAPASMKTRLRYFLVRLERLMRPPGAVASLTTYDARGHVIERWRLPRPSLPRRSR